MGVAQRKYTSHDQVMFEIAMIPAEQRKQKRQCVCLCVCTHACECVWLCVHTHACECVAFMGQARGCCFEWGAWGEPHYRCQAGIFHLCDEVPEMKDLRFLSVHDFFPW